METLGQAAADLLQQMGFEVGRIYPHVVRAVWAKAIGDLIVELSVLGVIPLVYRLMKHWFHKAEGGNDAFGIAIAAVGIAYGFILIIVACSIGNTVSALIEPEGTAVIQVLKGMK